MGNQAKTLLNNMLTLATTLCHPMNAAKLSKNFLSPKQPLLLFPIQFFFPPLYSVGGMLAW